MLVFAGPVPRCMLSTWVGEQPDAPKERLRVLLHPGCCWGCGQADHCPVLPLDIAVHQATELLFP